MALVYVPVESGSKCSIRWTASLDGEADMWKIVVDVVSARDQQVNLDWHTITNDNEMRGFPRTFYFWLTGLSVLAFLDGVLAARGRVQD